MIKAQLQSQDFGHDGPLALAAVGMIGDALTDWGDDNTAYSVQASGHGSHGHVSLAIEIKTHGTYPAEIIDGEKLLLEMVGVQADEPAAESQPETEPVAEKEYPPSSFLSQAEEIAPSTGWREPAGDAIGWA